MNRLHPATIIVSILPRLKEAVQASLPVIIGSVVAGKGGNHDWFAIFIGLMTSFLAIGTYVTTRFSIETDHVAHKSGWIFRNDRRIPLEQIQNVNIRQNLLERIFKVATVDVETAMGKGRDLKLSVLGLAHAERFREELLGAAHLNLADRTQVEEPLVTLNQHDLFLGAVTENHLQQVLVGMFTVIIPGVGWIITLASKQRLEVAAHMFGTGIVVFVIGSWLWGVISYYLKFGGFKVYQNEQLFRISYGIINRAQLAIRPGRIEYMNLTTTLPQRWMKRASLHIGTAGSFGEAGVLAPVALFVDRKRAYESVSGIFQGLNLEDLDWQPFHPIFYRSRLYRGLLTMALSGVAGVFLASHARGMGPSFIYVILFFILMIAGARLTGLFLSRPENGFAITDQALVVRRGYFHQSISAIPITRMENMAITQPWWWKRFDCSRFQVQGMKHRVFVGGMNSTSIDRLISLWHIDRLPAPIPDSATELVTESETTESQEITHS